MRILGLFLLLLNLNSFAENHGNERSNTPLAVKRPIASTPNSVSDDFKSEYENAKKDDGGCLWREQDWRRSETDQDYKHLMDKICRAEKITMDLANKDRKRYCPKPLILDQRLAYISRLNAIRLIKEGGMGHPNPHSAWYKGLPQKWFKGQFQRQQKSSDLSEKTCLVMAEGELSQLRPRAWRVRLRQRGFIVRVIMPQWSTVTIVTPV